ncbi:hypothetical protein [Pedobacter sp. MC2016-24]|uniref:hypothetical protein n=1 Tax=Pedobacter sp. MC2016-24 TaxID=2780090 RepID=UPI00187EB5AF|nr:hypothetical protein [Pedobacter sp. MC2016-24]MBE9600994.1 hypothetical protein [Pedobacter sp. MC2016-24]
MGKHHKLKVKTNLEESDNLGLDADQSSYGSSKLALNDDNERISGNADGENDNKVYDDHDRFSPLEDK